MPLRDGLLVDEEDDGDDAVKLAIGVVKESEARLNQQGFSPR